MFGVAVMLANNPKAQEAGFIFDLWTQPYEELGGLDSWKTRFQLRLARDNECYESIKLACTIQYSARCISMKMSENYY